MLRSRLSDDLKTAMRARDTLAVSTIRMILAALKDRDIAARGDGNTAGLADDQILELLQKLVKQRDELILLYDRGGRVELAAKERSEIEVIRRYLPQPMSDGEIEAAIADTKDALGASGIKDMGRVMAELRARYAGRMDFGKASAAAKRVLG